MFRDLGRDDLGAHLGQLEKLDARKLRCWGRQTVLPDV